MKMWQYSENCFMSSLRKYKPIFHLLFARPKFFKTIRRAHREIDPESGLSRPNLDCNDPFPIPNGHLFGANSIKKW